MATNPLSNIFAQDFGMFKPDTPPYKWTGMANTTPYMIAKTPAAAAPAVAPAAVPKVTAPIFGGGAAAPAAAAPAVDLYAKYRDPKTGNIMTPEEYALYLGNKVPGAGQPKGTGDVPQTAGDAMVFPNEPVEDLTKRATNLNNARNDIATGTTDPYGAGVKSGIAYSPAELKAIEKAYSGVYDPALNDVFSRLKDKQAEEDKKAAREEQVFKTNEAIRQWKSTTGTKSSGGGSGSGSTKDLFTQTQLNTAARNAGVSVGAIEDMDPDLVNYFVTPPKAKRDDGTTATIDTIFNEDFQRIINGETTADEVSAAISDSPLSEAVKHYYIDQIPAEPAKKESWIGGIWNAIWGK